MGTITVQATAVLPLFGGNKLPFLHCGDGRLVQYFVTTAAVYGDGFAKSVGSHPDPEQHFALPASAAGNRRIFRFGIGTVIGIKTGFAIRLCIALRSACRFCGIDAFSASLLVSEASANDSVSDGAGSIASLTVSGFGSFACFCFASFFFFNGFLTNGFFSV
jgi:hypothetical protein